MKGIKVVSVLVLVTALLVGCQEKVERTLYTADQHKGLVVGNKFHCLLNQEGWQAEFSNDNQNPFYLIYNESTGKLLIRANRISSGLETGETNQTFAIQQFVPFTGTYKADAEITYFRDNINCGSYLLDGENNTSVLEITKLDEVDNFISGRFEFLLFNSDCEDTIHVEQGLFQGTYIEE